MAELFGLSERELIFFKAQSIASGDWKNFKINKDEAFEYFLKLCKFLNFDELSRESIADAAYTSCQDTLLKQENLPVELLLNLASFDLFGQMNFGDFLQAWVNGKEPELKNLFQIIFKEGWEEERAEYAELNRKIFDWRLSAFEKYKTVADANRLIDRIGLESCAWLSTDEFMERLEIRMTRPSLTDHEIFLVSVCNVAAGQLDSVGLDRDRALDFIITLCENVNFDKGTEQAVQGIYTPT